MKLSFIGCGNMARAMISGILDKGLVKADDIYGSNATAGMPAFSMSSFSCSLPAK